MGKHTGAHSIKEKLCEYGIALTDEQIAEVVDKVKKLAESGKEVDDAELVALASTSWARRRRSSSKMKLKEFTVFTGMNITPTSTVVDRHRWGHYAAAPTSASDRWTPR